MLGRTHADGGDNRAPSCRGPGPAKMAQTETPRAKRDIASRTAARCGGARHRRPGISREFPVPTKEFPIKARKIPGYWQGNFTQAFDIK
jgi:hypothetical protein